MLLLRLTQWFWIAIGAQLPNSVSDVIIPVVFESHSRACIPVLSNGADAVVIGVPGVQPIGTNVA